MAAHFGPLRVVLCALAWIGLSGCARDGTVTTPGAAPHPNESDLTGRTNLGAAPSLENSRDHEAGANDAVLTLPDIVEFQRQRSARFLVDVEFVTAGHPFLGKRSAHPHTGAHVHWDNSDSHWPRGGNEARHYPAIYAVADGYIERTVRSFPVGENDRYGIYLAFAQSNGRPVLFEYSIEPMVKEPAAGFYDRFLHVRDGQSVKKGDVIAHLFLPPHNRGSHIHFEILSHDAQRFMAPAIFTRDVVESFAEHWGNGPDEKPLPACMGYMLEPGENPYEQAAVDILL